MGMATDELYFKPQLKVISDDQIARLHEATLEVLERTGFKITHPRALEILALEEQPHPDDLVDARTGEHRCAVGLARNAGRGGQDVVEGRGSRAHSHSIVEGGFVLMS